MIVVGIDGSQESKATLRFALEEARRWQTELHVVHAFSEWEPIPGTDELEGDRGPAEREEWLAGLVRDVLGDVADVKITQSTVEDDPTPALLAAASSADLLILGSRGHGGFADLLLGSTSLQCAHHASCPVMIVRAPKERALTH